jgi:hypothetical protein
MKDLQQIVKKLEEAEMLAKNSGHQLLTYLIVVALQEARDVARGGTTKDPR